ncbi:uncharacterized protein LOC119897176 isoform X1 [Micropterus salmoides]|uniref:uncharacterized protein LOC119897176 isoform X1 n=1 Tax=Micropterus salmoides TaxID=27706 RepID=UPI0018EC78BA|nr:uncharacterized protein LOC119897176 isoform X1 [Micropterus salmoides]
MLKIILSDRQWMFLYFMVSGTCCLVTVHQPPVLTTALGDDVMMPCQLNISHSEKMVTLPVLYWVYVTQGPVRTKVWFPSGRYEGRVDLLDNNANSSNKSIHLKNVHWADSGKYLCKLSMTTQKAKSFRKIGDGTFLLVHDTMMFNLTSHNDSLLWCEVNVTQDPRLVLSIFHDGHKLQTVESALGENVTALPYVTLSEAVSLRSAGKYECQLHLNKDLITKSIFHYHPSEEDGYAKNVSVTCPTTTSGVEMFPEPWAMYIGLLLVPITILLGLVITLPMCRS